MDASFQRRGTDCSCSLSVACLQVQLASLDGGLSCLGSLSRVRYSGTRILHVESREFSVYFVRRKVLLELDTGSSFDGR